MKSFNKLRNFCFGILLAASSTLAQTTPNLNSPALQACSAGATGTGRLMAIVPVNFGITTLYVPVCLNIGANLAINSTVTPPTLEAIVPSQPPIEPPLRMVQQRVPLNPTTPPEVTTLTTTLSFTPAPHSLIIAFWRSSILGGDAVDVAQPAGPDFKSVIITLPTYRPFRAADLIILVYWTRDPA